jgi:hypothetical protein
MLQYPMLTKKDLVDYFYEEVKFQNHSTLKRKGDTISFSVTPFTSKYLRSRNKFNSYSDAEFKILEENGILTVSFVGVCKNIIYVSLVIPSIFFVVGIYAAIAIYNPIFLLLASVFLVIISLLLLFLETIGIQLYLTNKINRIRENLRDNQSLH